MKKNIIIATLTLLSVFCASCLSFEKTLDSTKPLNGKIVAENLGETSGSDTTFYFLTYMIGQPAPEDAIAEALENKHADALVNVRMTERFFPLIIFSFRRFAITGEAVKLADAETEPAAVKTKKKGSAK